MTYKRTRKQRYSPIDIDPKSEADFKKTCQNIKFSLENINSHEHVNHHDIRSDHLLTFALSGSTHHNNLSTMYDYYRTPENTEEWSKPIVEKYTGKSFIFMLDFLRSLDTYFSVTLDSSATQKVLGQSNKDSKASSERVYKVWKAHLEECLTKIEIVLDSLKTK